MLLITNNIKNCRAGPNFTPCGICKPCHTHYCKVCKKKDVTHRSANCPKIKNRNKILKNASVICISMNKKYVYMVFEKNYRKWVFPGGKINKKDKNKLFKCAKREWFEEVGSNLPNFVKKNGLRGLEKYDSNHHKTRLYFGYTNDKIYYNNNITQMFGNETSKGRWVKISDIINGNFKEIRGCCKNSFVNLIFNYGI